MALLDDQSLPLRFRSQKQAASAIYMTFTVWQSLFSEKGSLSPCQGLDNNITVRKERAKRCLQEGRWNQRSQEESRLILLSIDLERADTELRNETAPDL